MKRIFYGLITFMMLFAVSLIVVKANNVTVVTLEDGVQIRTDEHSGLRWQAQVENALEGQIYGFLFAQGDLETVTVDTVNVVNKSVEELNEDGTFAATMVKFPKAAATQDISVVAYVYDGTDYIYSNVVVRNLSEVAIEAYEKGLEGDFVKAVYDASLTTFNFTDGNVFISSYSMSDYNHFYSVNGVMLHGKGRCSASGSAAWTGEYDRIFMKYDAFIDAYRVVALNSDGWKHQNFASQDFDLVLMNSDGATDSNFVEKLADAKDVRNYIFKIDSSVELNYETSDKNIASNVTIEVYENVNALKIAEEKQLHLGGNVKLPVLNKPYYDFNGWYDDEEFTGSAIQYQNASRNLYAKFTPTNYTISYILGDGVWESGFEPTTTYNYESNEIVLPTQADAKINDGTFLGWYDNVEGKGTPITSIPKNSHGNVKLYAIWKMNAPTVVELSAKEKEIVDAYAPTLFVSDKFGSGKFIINDVTYEVGVNLFASIASALANAKENDVVYVFDGNYNEKVVISVNGLTLLGSNADVNPNTETKQPDTSIVTLNVKANNVTVNGFNFTDNLQKEVESILISAGVANCTLANCTIVNQTKFNTNGNGLIKALGSSGKEITNLTIKNFKVEKGALRPTLFYGGGIYNFTVKDSSFLGSASAYLYTDSVKIVSGGNYGIKGNVTFTGNTFKDYGQYLIWLTYCADVNVNVSLNKFINCGQSDTNHAAVYVASAASSFTKADITMENNIVDNSYMLFRVASVSAFTATSFVAELHNNSVINSKAILHIKNQSAGTVNAENNYYGGTPTQDKFTGVAAWNPYLTEDPNN